MRSGPAQPRSHSLLEASPSVANRCKLRLASDNRSGIKSLISAHIEHIRQRRIGIDFDIAGAGRNMQSEWFGGGEGSTEDPKKEDDNEAPETPLDEPRPPRIQDPPPQPDPKHPYVVSTSLGRPQAARG